MSTHRPSDGNRSARLTLALVTLVALATGCGNSNNTVFGFADADCDNIVDAVDMMFNDVDGDLRGDMCDNCPTFANPVNPAGGADCNGDGDMMDVGESAGSQCDNDRDGMGDVCDPDDDDDGILDDGAMNDLPIPAVPPNPSPVTATPCVGGAVAACDDNCQFIANATQVDGDMDGIGDVCDPTP